MHWTFQRLQPDLPAFYGGAIDFRGGSIASGASRAGMSLQLQLLQYASTALSSSDRSLPSISLGESADFQIAPPNLLLACGFAAGSLLMESSVTSSTEVDQGTTVLGKLDLALREPWHVFFTTAELAVRPQQRLFWKLFDAIENYESIPASYTALLQPITMSEVRSTVGGWFETCRLSDHFSEWISQRDLSARDIRSILAAVALSLEQRGEALSASAVLTHVHETLVKEVNDRVKWRFRQHHTITAVHGIASTHDWVLAFAFHTGISPPTWAWMRLTVGWALVRRINALKVNYETVRRRQTCRDLRNALHGRCTRARFYSGSRNRTPLSSCLQSPRRGRAWPDYQASQHA
jgi:hypothetical protein